MKTISLTIVLLFLFTGLTPGQDVYMILNGRTTVGVPLVDQLSSDNFRYCQVKKGDSIKRYTPYEVSAYRFADGRVYIAKDIDLKGAVRRVFLQRLVSGKSELYYYGIGRKTFFLEKDSALTEISRKGPEKYKTILAINTSDCQEIKPALKAVDYSKVSMAEYVQMYNDCQLRDMSFLRYGVSFGLTLTKMIKPPLKEDPLVPVSVYREIIDHIRYTSHIGYTGSIFIEKPNFDSKFSWYSEIGLSYFKSKYNYNEDIYYEFSYTAINVPLEFRRSFQHTKMKPFAGIGLDYMAYLNNNSRFQYQDVLLFKKPLMAEMYLGPVFSAGIRKNISYRNTLYYELRYMRLFGFKKESFRTSELQFRLAINI